MNDYNIHEFTDDIWMLIPENVISNKYIDENSDYFRDLLFFFYKKRLNGFSNEVLAEIITEFFKASFEHKPKMENVLDDDFNLV